MYLNCSNDLLNSLNLFITTFNTQDQRLTTQCIALIHIYSEILGSHFLCSCLQLIQSIQTWHECDNLEDCNLQIIYQTLDAFLLVSQKLPSSLQPPFSAPEIVHWRWKTENYLHTAYLYKNLSVTYKC